MFSYLPIMCAQSSIGRGGGNEREDAEPIDSFVAAG